jgi:hypothetical protein
VSLLPLKIPPGMVASGTDYQNGPRWVDGSLVLFASGRVMPWGGWVTFTTNIVGMARAMVTYSLDDGTPRIVVGTHLHLYHVAADGTKTDITPAGYTTGSADGTSGGGYGSGLFGSGLYGAMGADDGTTQPATVWTLSVRGDVLIACNNEDGNIYQWDGNTAAPAVIIGTAPLARAALVAEEGFVFAIGSAGNPHQISWSDQIDITDWTPTPGVNQAGSVILQTSGLLMAGARVSGAALFFTGSDVHRATYAGAAIQYSFERIADDGLIAVGAFAVTGENQLFFMGNQGFWAYNGGFVQRVECDLNDLVFENLNLQQKSKVTCYHEPKYQFVRWFYTSNASLENDRYVTYYYGSGVWDGGALERTAAAKRGGPFSFPFMIDPDGNLLQHEVGHDRDGLECFIESGPIEIASGQNVMNVMNIVPDEISTPGLSRTLYGAMSPTSDETEYGPYAHANPINTRLQARQVRLRIDFPDLQDARYGTDRLDIKTGGERLG